MNWQRLGDRLPTELEAARLQLHWAAQLVSAVGTTLLPAAPDDSHTNLEWLAKPGLLAGRLIPEAPRCRAALRPSHLCLCILDEHGAAVAERGLDGLTFGQGMVWLEQELAAFTQRPLARPLRRRELDLPDHPVAHGAAFSTRDRQAFAELGRWYANADAALRAFAESTHEASEVRCWPHHFDIATLLAIDPGADQERRRTIGVGMSPGDATYAQPYWYVTPWPYPDNPQPPTIRGGGEWHQTGWFGAVLPGMTVSSTESAAAQANRVDTFLRSAVEICRALIDPARRSA